MTTSPHAVPTLLAAPRVSLRYAQYAVDLACLAGAYWLAHALRFDFDIPEAERAFALERAPLVLAYQTVLVWVLGVHRFVWRYVGLREVGTFVRGALLAIAPLIVLRLTLPDELRAWRMPISVAFLDGTLAFAGLLGARVLRRVVFERVEHRSKSRGQVETKNKRVLLVGAGKAGQLAAREIHGNPHSALTVVGFVDDDPAKRRAMIEGVPVLGRTSDIAELRERHQINQVIITIATASRSSLRRIILECDRSGLPVRIIPGLYEILGGRVEVSRIRDVEIEDLLGREPVQLDSQTVAQLLTESAVLVTGAGGSIGSELCRQIAQFRPSRLVLLERSEPALFNVHRELHQAFPDLEILPVVADVTDSHRVACVMEKYRPRVVLHAAAHKHVPLMEVNVCEAIQNNIFGTRTVAELAAEHGVEVFVLVSTDKAVHPSSVMGTTKRAAEMVVQALDAQHETRFVAVRFGNVLGSAGSVIPIFREQIRQGGPLTVTHPDMLRFFMTIPEAAQLVLQAGAMGEGGEIFILDMGEPVRIVDLARDMIRLSGLRPDEDIQIVFTGVRPGEKLIEELASDAEVLAQTPHSKIAIGRIPPVAPNEVDAALRGLAPIARGGDDLRARSALGELVPEATISLRSVSN